MFQYAVSGGQLTVNWEAARKIRESNDKSLKAALARHPKSVKLDFPAGEMTWTIEADGVDEDGREGHVVAQWIFKRI